MKKKKIGPFQPKIALIEGPKVFLFGSLHQSAWCWFLRVVWCLCNRAFQNNVQHSSFFKFQRFSIEIVWQFCESNIIYHVGFSLTWYTTYFLVWDNLHWIYHTLLKNNLMNHVSCRWQRLYYECSSVFQIHTEYNIMEYTKNVEIL